MDPQERLFLQCGVVGAGGCGVAPARAWCGGWMIMGLAVGPVCCGVMYGVLAVRGDIQGYSARARVAWIGPNRCVYFCDLHGPSLAVDTMCSSSLTAIHLASQSLARGGSARWRWPEG